MTEIRSDAFSVSNRTCVLVVTVTPEGQIGGLRAEWEPGRPTRLDKADLAQYRAIRDSFLEQVSAQTGHGIAVVDRCPTTHG